MRNHKESYREFELERLLWMAGETPEPTAESAEATKEAPSDEADGAAKSPEQKAEESKAEVAKGNTEARGAMDQGQSPEAKEADAKAQQEAAKEINAAKAEHDQETAENGAHLKEAQAEADGFIEGKVGEGEETEAEESTSAESAEPTGKATPTSSKVIDGIMEEIWGNDGMRAFGKKMVEGVGSLGEFKEKAGEDKNFMANLEKTVSSLSEETQKKLESNGSLDDKGLKELGEAMIEAFGLEEGGSVDQEEIDLLNTLELNGEKSAEAALGNGFVRLLSIHNKIEKMENGKGVKVTPEGGKAVIVTKGVDLIRYLPEEHRAKYMEYANNKERTEGDLWELKQSMEQGADKEEAAQSLVEMMRDPSKIKDIKESSPLSILATFVQLMKMFRDAQKSGDFSVFTDAMDAIKENGIGGLKDAMDKASKDYDKGLAKIGRFDDLLAMYAKPSGEVAEKHFPDGKFRAQMQPKIMEQLSNRLGISIAAINPGANDTYQIKQQDGSDRYDIWISRNSGGYSVSIDKKAIVDGSEQVAPGGKGEKVQMGESELNLDDLAKVIAKGPQVGIQEPNAEEAPAPEGEEAVTEGGETQEESGEDKAESTPEATAAANTSTDDKGTPPPTTKS